jgi:hypothetical protein
MLTRKSSLVAAALLIGAAAFGTGLSIAQSGPGQSGPGKAQPARFDIGSDPSFGEVRARMADQGFDVHDIDFDEGEIEVKGLDAFGRCLEIYFSPGSGAEVKRERDDDCAPFGRVTPGSDDDRCDVGEDRWKD